MLIYTVATRHFHTDILSDGLAAKIHGTNVKDYHRSDIESKLQGARNGRQRYGRLHQRTAVEVAIDYDICTDHLAGAVRSCFPRNCTDSSCRNYRRSTHILRHYVC